MTLEQLTLIVRDLSYTVADMTTRISDIIIQLATLENKYATYSTIETRVQELEENT